MDPRELRERLRTEGTLALAIRVIPKSRKTGWAGPLKVRIAAVPERGKANEELVRFLAQELDVPRSAITIVAGATSQNKQVRVTRPA